MGGQGDDQNMLSALSIIGKGIVRHNYTGILIIGNQKDGVNIEELASAIYENIDSNTIITVNAHGALINGEHSILLSKNIEYFTSDFLNRMQLCAPGVPLQVDLMSCYSGNAKKTVKHLSAGSVLTTDSKENKGATSAIEFLRFSEHFKEYLLESNPYTRFINQLPFKSASFSSLTVANAGLDSFEITPTHEALLSRDNAKEFLEREVQRFIEFSKDKVWNGKIVDLALVKFSDEQIDIFAKAFFLYECHTNPEFSQFLERHLPTNEYLQESVSYRVDNKATSLEMAVISGNANIVKLLIKFGADIDEFNKNGWTLLGDAVLGGNHDMVELLIEFGADLEKPSKNGWTPLGVAAECGDYDMVELLIESGADLEKLTYDGGTPLDFAVVRGKTDIAKLLIEAGADVNKLMRDGNIPLGMAVIFNNLELVELLVESGADVNQPMKDGSTPLDKAVMYGNSEMEELLRKYIKESKHVSSDEGVVVEGLYDSDGQDAVGIVVDEL